MRADYELNFKVIICSSGAFYQLNTPLIDDRAAIKQITPISSVLVRTWAEEGGGGVYRLRGPRGSCLPQLHSQVRC